MFKQQSKAVNKKSIFGRYNDIQHNDIQYNDIQYNDIQHNSK